MIHTTPSGTSYLRPRWPFASVNEGSLNIKGTPVENLVKRFGTPFYLIVEEEIRARLRQFRKAFPYMNFRPQYAVKCNSNIEILKIVREEGFDADASSIGEIILSMLAGFRPDQITFTNLCKTEQDIIFAAQAGVNAITLDSLEEVRKAIKAAANCGSKINTFLRINPKIHYGEYCTTHHQYGIPIEQAREAIDLISAAQNIEVIGVHWHGAYIWKSEIYSMAMRALMPIAKYAISAGNNVKYLDLGGGFPVAYGDNTIFSIDDMGPAFVDEMQDMLEEMELPELTLVFEPGKFIVNNAGMSITKVISVKDLGERKVAIVDGSTYAMIPDPLIWECHYDVLPANKMLTAPGETYDIHGCTCDYLDRLGKERQLPQLEEGDILAFMDCGAYSNVLASNFNTLKRPPMILIKEDGSVQTIRRRDRYSEMFAPELDITKTENGTQLKQLYNLVRHAATRNGQEESLIVQKELSKQ